MIEVAIVLPIMLLMLLFFVVLGIRYYYMIGIRAEIERGLRLAITRAYIIEDDSAIGLEGTLLLPQQPWFTNHGTIDEGTIGETKDLLKLLYHPNLVPAERNVITNNIFTNLVVDNDSFSGCDDLQKDDCPVPRELLYAAIYVIQGVSLVLGEGVFYPCAAQQLDNCFSCRLFNPLRNDGRFLIDTSLAAPPIIRGIGIRCEYRPQAILLPLYTFFGLINQGGDSPVAIAEAGSFYAN